MKTDIDRLREKIEVSEKGIKLILSKEETNNDVFGDKKIKISIEGEQEFIGSISFDYISKSGKKFIQVKGVFIKNIYSRKGLSLILYNHLINIALKKGLNGICSDHLVQNGAIISWKKLKEQGFNLSVYPELLSKFDQLCAAYDDGKYFKDSLSSNSNESVFTINLK
jgi:Acetyltransferase (GNAT) family